MGEPEILIVGAGPTGLVLALRLVRHGVPFRIVSAAAGPGEASRAMVVHARTLELYDQIGLADAVVAGGVRVTKAHIRQRGHETGVLDLDGGGAGISPFPFALAYPQDDHERLLVARLAELGVEVEWGTTLTGLEQDSGEVRATLVAEGRESVVGVPYLVGCDGAHSRVRHSLGIGFDGGAYEQLFYVADVEIEKGFVADLTVTLGDGGFVLLLPVRSRGVQRLIGVAPPGVEKGADFEAVRASAEGLAGVRVTKVNWFSTYGVSHRVASRFREGRCFIAGDAGHIHSPAGGQGMNTGIGDAVNLSWKLAQVLQGRAGAAILDTYEVERIAFARALVATTDRGFRAVVSRSWVGSAVRQVLPHAMGWLTGFSAVRRTMFGVVSQVRISYHGSGLSEGKAGEVAGGDRLPWVEGAGGGNHAALRSVDWQVHVHGEVSAAFEEACRGAGVALHGWDWTPGAEAAGFARDAAYVMRPDGYVGLALPTQDVGGLLAYLARLGLRGADPVTPSAG